MGRNITARYWFYLSLYSDLSHFLIVCWAALRRSSAYDALHCNIFPGQLVFCLSLSINAALAFSLIYILTSLWFAKEQQNTLAYGDTDQFPLSIAVLTHHILISYDDVITLNIASSLHPHHHLNTWWPRTDEATLNGIQSPWPWRTASAINHSVFWNTNSLLMPIRSLNVDPHVHITGYVAF